MRTHTRSVGLNLAAVTVICFSISLFFAAPVSVQSQQVYPGAVPKISGSNQVYLVDASFEDVRDFYMRTVGNPTQESGPGRQVSFVYSTVSDGQGTTEHTAVRIRCQDNTGTGYNEVMSELRSNQRRGFVTAARLAEIEARYQTLGELYYTDLGEGPIDTHIVSRYERYLQTGMWMEHQEFTDMLQRLMMEGKHEELSALSEEMEAGIDGLIALKSTAAQVEFWVECLNEIETAADEHGFPVMIELEHTFRTGAGRKG